MRLNLQASCFVASPNDLEAEARRRSDKKAAPHTAKPRKKPNVDAARKRVFARYSKTLAYLAK